MLRKNIPIQQRHFKGKTHTKQDTQKLRCFGKLIHNMKVCQYICFTKTFQGYYIIDLTLRD